MESNNGILAVKEFFGMETKEFAEQWRCLSAEGKEFFKTEVVRALADGN